MFDQVNCFRIYRTALALNGTGVTLLERHRYRDAMLTFKDALDFIKVAHEDDIRYSERAKTASEFGIGQHLRAASNRLMRSSAEETPCAFQLHVKTLSENQSPKQTLHIAHMLLDSDCAFAFHFDDRKTMEYGLSHELDCAVILYNFATAYLCHLRTQHTTKIEQYEGPYKFFHLAFCILSRKPILAEPAVDDVDAVRILAVTSLVVKNLMEISIILESLNDAKSYFKKLCCLREAFCRLERFPCFTMLLMNSHAAVA
jgi:hypothetical protein